MQTAVRKFFALHHHLSLPGIGNFRIQTEPAQIDFVNRHIAPPPCRITFSNDSLSTDKGFFEFLSQELKIDEQQAALRFAEFTSSLKSELNKQKTIYLQGIGHLTRQSSHSLNFQPEETANNYFPVLTAERVIRKNSTHVIKVGEHEKTSTEMQTVLQQEEKKLYTKTRRERWWIPAAILAFVGILGLIIYYATHTS